MLNVNRRNLRSQINSNKKLIFPIIFTFVAFSNFITPYGEMSSGITREINITLDSLRKIKANFDSEFLHRIAHITISNVPINLHENSYLKRKETGVYINHDENQNLTIEKDDPFILMFLQVTDPYQFKSFFKNTKIPSFLIEASENNEQTNYNPNRFSIPSEVKREVWRRDQGKCSKCGSRENLEYDHIIPVSKGGSNTVRNIELLCQNCNRSKSNKIL